MLLAPENKGITKYIRWITSLCVTYALLIPLASIGGEVKELFNGIEKYESETIIEESASQELVISVLKDRISDSVGSSLKDRFNTECLDVSIELDESDIENISLAKISVVLNTKSDFLISDCGKFLQDLFMCEVEVKGESESG